MMIWFFFWKGKYSDIMIYPSRLGLHGANGDKMYLKPQVASQFNMNSYGKALFRTRHLSDEYNAYCGFMYQQQNLEE
jgi:hypothetical protein